MTPGGAKHAGDTMAASVTAPAADADGLRSAEVGNLSTAATRDLRTPETDDLRTTGATAIAAARDGARHLVELAAAEARLAAMSGISMLLAVIVAAALLIVAWGLVAGVAGYLLVAAGLSWPAAGLSLAAVHLIVAFVLWRTTMRLSRNLTLPVLRRTVLGSSE